MKIFDKKHTSLDTKFSKLNWSEIQKYYDENRTWTDILNKYDLTTYALVNAVKKGLFKTRDRHQTLKVRGTRHRFTKEELRLNAIRNKLGGYRENAGHSKKFKVKDSFGKETTLQSTYELSMSNLLNELNIKWLRPKALKYNNKNYFPDFYLTDYNVYIDTKNDYLIRIDNAKIQQVILENNIKLYVISLKQITKEYILSIITPS